MTRCERQPALRRAFSSLLAEADYLSALRGDPNGWWHRLRSLPVHPTAGQRQALRTVVPSLKRLAADTRQPELDRAVASLLLALVEGGEAADSVSVEGLRRIPRTYQKQRTVSFVSQWYLALALDRRGRTREAAKVAHGATRTYRHDEAVSSLVAYKVLPDMVSGRR